jgi:uncharacterized protein
MAASKSIWVDTSFLYALLDASDAEHVHASQTLQKKGNRKLATSFDVRSELYTLCLMRLGWHAAHDSLALCDDLCDVVHLSNAGTWRDAAAFTKWRDQKFSMVDCLSFAWMKRLKITHFVGYDGHFRTARFSLFE